LSFHLTYQAIKIPWTAINRTGPQPAGIIQFIFLIVMDFGLSWFV
jgi:hypothetical protein